MEHTGKASLSGLLLLSACMKTALTEACSAEEWEHSFAISGMRAFIRADEGLIAVCGVQRDSRRIGLWRSGRERGVWLLDVQRAATCHSASAAAYAASVIRDRSSSASCLSK